MDLEICVSRRSDCTTSLWDRTLSQMLQLGPRKKKPIFDAGGCTRTPSAQLWKILQNSVLSIKGLYKMPRIILAQWIYQKRTNQTYQINVNILN